MTIMKRIETLEQRAGKRRGRIHVHYPPECQNDHPCAVCAASGPPKPGDTVIKVEYETPPNLEGVL